MFANCTSTLGASYIGFVVAELTESEMPKEHLNHFANCMGENRFFLVYDYEYDDLVIKKLGYDIELLPEKV